MISYVHELPGRLRIRIRHLKGDKFQVDSVREMLSAIPGVLACEANVTTGSILVRFDPQDTNSPKILERLEECGYRREIRVSSPTSAETTDFTNRAAKAVAGALFEKVLERSATALVAALV